MNKTYLLFKEFLTKDFLTNEKAKQTFENMISQYYIKQSVMISLQELKVFRRNIDDLKDHELKYAQAIICYIDEFILLLEKNCEKSILG